MKKIYTFLAAFLLCLSAQASDLFVKINSNNTFYAMVGLQSHSNGGAIFRFFDLPQGSNNLKIYFNNSANIFFESTINLDFNERVICEISSTGYLTIVERQKMTVQNWYTSYPQNGNNGTNWGGNNNSNLDLESWKEFVKVVKEESFDSNRMDKCKSYATKTNLSAAQITELALLYSFDSGKLDWAKLAYKYCYDKQNYFLLKSAFTFSSSYSDLEKFIEKQ